ncbi:MAG: glycosyltransferase family 4 protein [Chloroflexi bacterium]|nr:glycosyltransferase family 4 protein [Chloroflexota bacterium]
MYWGQPRRCHAGRLALPYTPETATTPAPHPPPTWERSLITRPLHVLIASGTFHPESGGPPTYLLRLGRELMARGHRLTVVTYGDEPADPPRRYPYPVYRVPRGLPTAAKLALFAREVWRHGRRADLLFVNDYGLPAAVANLALGKPLVMKIVGDFAWEYAVRHGLVSPDEPFDRFQAARYGPKVEALRRMQAGYVRAADRVIVPSSFVKWYVEGWGADPARVRVVQNAVDNPTAGLAGDRATIRAGLDVGPDERVVLVVARLTVWKGVDTVMAALGQLGGDLGRRARLVVVGDGPDRARLEGLASALPPGTVRLLGELPHAEVGRWMAAADALALLSGYEGLSHVLLEAMAAGLPVLVSDVGGNRALVTDQHDGLAVPYGDVAATTSALCELLSDGATAQTIRRNALAGAAERTVSRMVDRTLGVFLEALDRDPDAEVAWRAGR